MVPIIAPKLGPLQVVIPNRLRQSGPDPPDLGRRREEYLRRYEGVIHLQTAAIGAEPHYRRTPEAHRSETLAKAAEIDALCAAAWQAHPRYTLIANDGRDWPAKARAAQDLLQSWLAVETGGVHQ